MEKKAQVQVTFNWIYVLVAGVVILLFFLSLAVRQKDVAENQLSQDVITSLNSIFTAATVSEKTKNVIATSALAEYTLSFECEEGVSRFGIRDRQGGISNAIDPIFSPLEMKGTSLLTLSMPYKMPFKVADLLMVTSSSVKYIIVHPGERTPFISQFLELTDGFTIEVVPSLADVEIGNAFHLRVLDLEGTFDYTSPFPPQFDTLEDHQITAVSVTEEASYYQREGSRWALQRKVPIISLPGQQYRNAALIAALFAGDANQYTCNMDKALTRLDILLSLFKEKRTLLEEHYTSIERQDCLDHLQPEGVIEDAEELLVSLHDLALTCQRTYQTRLPNCDAVSSTAQLLDTRNTLLGGVCVSLY